MKVRTRCMIILMIALIGSLLFTPLSYGRGDIAEPAKDNPVTLDTKKILSLKLLGTIVETEPAKSLAVIKDQRLRRPGIYKIGDKILDYQITKILRGRILLLKQGKIFHLDFPLGSEVEPVIVISPEERIINRSALIKKIPDIPTAMQQATPLPYIESGKIIGFKISNIKDKALAKMAGLGEGDVVTLINGERINSIQKALEIYHNLGNQEKINLQIKRGSEIKNLIYYIN